MSYTPQPTGAVEIFYSYSHVSDDEMLRNELLKQLAGIERQGVIVSWHDRKITAGREWAGEIDEHINTAGVILLFVSPDFMASGYCNDIELKRAMERHEAGEARVIPIILRPTLWTGAPFEKLQMLPTDARAVTLWPNRDEALLVVAQGIHKAVRELTGQTATRQSKRTSEANIPRPPVVGFVARRDREGRDIVGLLKDELSLDKNQLVALWGPGGAGKTTIAAEVVRATEKDFNGRVVWASSLRRADFNVGTLLDEIATQLGCEDLRRLAPEPKAAQVAALISEAPTLIILDNFETVAEVEQARCLDFLAQNAACPVLITTRAFIDRDDVTNVELAAMEMDEAREFLRRLIERTPKKQNFTSLDHDDLIQKCEANPLLLQWVVRQVVLSKTPETALDYLSKGESDAAERVFTRSFDLPQLGDDGRAALVALSLFTPSASREALAEVAGFGGDRQRIDRAVARLSSLWLVETTESNERLLLRGLTRELSKSRLLKDARADEFRRNYVAYFQRYSESHRQSTQKDLDALETEKDNLLGSVEVASQASDLDGVMNICAVLNDFLLPLRGYWDDAIRTSEQGEAAARAAESDWNVAHFQLCVARIRLQRGEYQKAEGLSREALEIFRRLESGRNVLACLHMLGNIASSLDDLEEARRLYGEALEIERSLGDRSCIALTSWGLANIAIKQNDFEEAKTLFAESLETFKELDDQANAADVLNWLGVIAYDESQFETARRLFAESLDINKKLGNQIGIAFTLRNLGRLEEVAGFREEAVRLFLEALSIFEKLGSPESEATRTILSTIESAD